MLKRSFFTLIAILTLMGATTATRAAQSDSDAPAAGPSATDWPTTALPATLDVAAPGLVAPRAATHPRLDDTLAALAAPETRESETRDRAAAAEAAGLRLEEGRVQVRLVVGAEGEAAARAAVAAAGGLVTDALDDTLQAWLPPAELTAVAGAPGVAFVGAPNYAELAEPELIAQTSEGVAAANAPAWLAAGRQGQGVRIAIIDAGFQGYTSLLGEELPAAVVAKNFVDGQPDAEVNGTTPHGTACAEIVHDMAPQAQLYLIKISTDLDLSQALDYAISQNVDVISTSLTFINVTPGDGSGKFAAMAQRARDAGILWVTAAGNYRETHWGGPFTDADGDTVHEYAPGVEVNVFGPGNNTAYQIPAGVALSVAVRWDDWAAVNQDYRLHLVRHNGASFQIVATADNRQTGQPGQRPTERIEYRTSGATAIYGVAIARVSGARPVHFDLLTPNRELDRRVPVMSLGNLADAPAALTVAAVRASAPYPQEDYSSEGPTNGPGGAPTGGLWKPNLAAFAAVTTESYGTRVFAGTSAATPHVAGAAALALNAYPALRPGDVQTLLEDWAVDQGPTCLDTRFGFGRLFLNPPAATPYLRYNLFLPYMGHDDSRC